MAGISYWLGLRRDLVPGYLLLDLSRDAWIRKRGEPSSRAHHDCFLPLHGAAPWGIRLAGRAHGTSIDSRQSTASFPGAIFLGGYRIFSRSRCRRSLAATW